MLPEQKAYIYAWVDVVIAAGFRAGVYCSGIAAKESGVSIVTADDIRQNAGGRKIAYWVTNDACPAFAGMRVSQEAAGSRRKRRLVRRCMAIRPVPKEAGCGD